MPIVGGLDKPEAADLRLPRHRHRAGAAGPGLPGWPGAPARLISASIVRSLMAVPGPDLDRQGTANADVLKDWTARVLQLAGEAGFREVAEMLVARFSPNAPTDTDGTWPCQPVRDLLENLQSGLVERAGGRTLRGRTGQPPGQEPGDLTLR